MRTHGDKRREEEEEEEEGEGKGDERGETEGTRGKETGEMQIAVIDCIHEPRSTPTRVIRGNARAYWGA